MKKYIEKGGMKKYSEKRMQQCMEKLMSGISLVILLALNRDHNYLPE